MSGAFDPALVRYSEEVALLLGGCVSAVAHDVANATVVARQGLAAGLGGGPPGADAFEQMRHAQAKCEQLAAAAEELKSFWPKPECDTFRVAHVARAVPRVLIASAGKALQIHGQLAPQPSLPIPDPVGRWILLRIAAAAGAALAASLEPGAEGRTVWIDSGLGRGSRDVECTFAFHAQPGGAWAEALGPVARVLDGFGGRLRVEQEGPHAPVVVTAAMPLFTARTRVAAVH